MKKILTTNKFIVIALCLILIFTICTPTYAAENNNLTELSKNDLKLLILDETVSDDIHKQAINAYNQIIEKELKTQSARYGYLKKNYTSTTVKSYGDLKGKLHKTVTQGFNESVTVSVSISAGTKINSYTIGTGVSASKTTTVSGPGYNTSMPGSNLTATHANIIGILRGSIVHETYDGYDATTGNFIEHVDRYLICDADVTVYSQLVADQSGSYTVKHVAKSLCKTYSSKSAYKKVLESTSVKSAYSW